MSEDAPLPPIPKDDQSESDKSIAAPKDLEELIREISPEALETIPPETLEKLKGTKAFFVRQEHTRTELSMTRSAPLPPPSELTAYNEIIPQGADRIMRMAEAQSAHRIELEKNVVFSQQGQESKGQFFGFIIAIVGLLCGSYTAISGQPTAGAVIGGVPLAGLVSVFLYSKHRDTEKLEEKKNQLDPAALPANRNDKNQKKHKRQKK